MSEHLTVLDIIDKSTKYLNKRGVPNSKCDVEWIISHVTKRGKLELYLDFGNFLGKEDLNKIRQCIVNRGKRIPLQHILKKVNFAGYELNCDKRALIPRPETEYFTELIRERVPKEYKGKILDFGTGSGAIIITLCLEIKNCKGFGMDKSINALSLARENIELHNLKNVELQNFDWSIDHLKCSYGVIVSNPPYLTDDEWYFAEQEVKEFDPKGALVSQSNGLSDIHYIICHAKKHLLKDGLLALEIGIGQKNNIIQDLSDEFTRIEVIKDFCQRERFIFAYKK